MPKRTGVTAILFDVYLSLALNRRILPISALLILEEELASSL